MELNLAPKPASCRSGHISVYVPVAVFTPEPRITWPIGVEKSTLPHAQPAACAAGTAGGSLVVRAFACADAGDTVWLPSGNVTVIVALVALAADQRPAVQRAEAMA